jgi:7-carboxy-7-deazaguanine synthase
LTAPRKDRLPHRLSEAFSPLEAGGSRPYRVKEIFYSLQGEGAHSGRPSVFCRFSGCNLWSGREEDRAAAVCSWCDTDMVGQDGPGGGIFADPRVLAEAVLSFFPVKAAGNTTPWVVCTGGEPLLQLDTPLIEAFHRAGLLIAVETNGTLLPPAGIDWICVSPKAGAPLKCRSGNELKLVFPQEGLNPAKLESPTFSYFFLQPRDDIQAKRNRQEAVRYCLDHPLWRLSLQIHKILGIP